LKVAFISDLHVDISQKNWELVPQIAEVLKVIEPDVFLVCGDVSPELGDIEYALDCFSPIPCHKLFIPGNQDIWVMSERMQEEGHDSYEKYYFFLPEVCRRNNFLPLWMEPVIIRNVGFAGSIGWYDLTLNREEQLDLEGHETGKNYQDEIWNDLKWACWNDISCIAERELGPFRRPDIEVAREFVKRLDQDIESLSLSPEVKEIVVALHFPPFPQAIGPPDKNGERPCLSFMGSQEMGNMLLRHQIVSTIICGHLHKKREVMVEGKQVLCSPVGYLSSDHRKDYAIVEESLGIIYLFEEKDWPYT
jgi:predicted phosphohydrolase